MKAKIKIYILIILFLLPNTYYYFKWINNTFVSYKQQKQFTNKSLKIVGDIQYKELLKSTNLGKESHNNKVFILVKNKNLTKLTKNIPISSSKYIKSNIVINNKLYKGKLKLRGDNYYHWIFPQKSWRFKSKKSNLINGLRKIDFINPKHGLMIMNHLSYKLAKELKLLSPNTDIVDLYINDIYNGPKLMSENLDEGFLRRNRLMPNDIYKGDNIGSKQIRNIKVDLFKNPSIWDKKSYNNHYAKDNRIPLKYLLINKKLNLLDIDKFARFSAYIDLAKTYHFSSGHNWILYYDNYLEKFQPIVWDPMGWGIGWLKKTDIAIISSLLLYDLYEDYQFLYKKYEVLFNFLQNKNNFIKIVDNEIDNLKVNYKDSSVYIPDETGKPIDINEILDKLTKYKARIVNRFNDLEEYYFGKVLVSNYGYSINKNNLLLSIKDSKLISKINIKFIKDVDIQDIKNVSISYFVNGKKITKDIYSFDYDIKNNAIILNQQLLANASVVNAKSGGWTIKYDEAVYILNFPNITKIKEVSLDIYNFSRQNIKLSSNNNIDIKSFFHKKNIIDRQQQSSVVWGNTKHFSGFNIIKDNVIIKSGTKIIMDENTTLKILGKVTAIGTKENPIIFEPKDKTKPWNTFALKDDKANGSIFKHCIFRDGSGDKGDLYEYTAMLSIHNVKDFLVEDCEFYDSHRTDDMVHVIYSEGKFKDTKFIRSLSDALDVDISNVVVDNCEFMDSGNDAIDLMTTNAVVVNTRFNNSADKGISVGEGSHLLAINNYIKGSEIGMQSKDTSKAYIYNTSFVANKKAVDAYHKNWRYGEGGTIVLEHCVFKDNISNATVGKKSKVIINNSDIDIPNKFNKKSLKKKKIIISKDKFIKYDFKDKLFKDKNNLISRERRGCSE